MKTILPEPFNMILIIYVTVINLVAICMCLYDKYAAVHGKWRISEKTLLFTAFIGGATGLYIAMQIIKHKTRKRQFQIFVPFFIVLHVYIIIRFLF